MQTGQVGRRRVHVADVVQLCALVAVMLWSGHAYSQTYNGNLPEAYEEPGGSDGRVADASLGVETIDPFTGALKLVVTDLVI